MSTLTSGGVKGGESMHGERVNVSTKVVALFGIWLFPISRSISTEEEAELVEFSFCIMNIEEGLWDKLCKK